MGYVRIRAALSLALLLSGATACLGRSVPLFPPGVDGTDVSLIACTGENCPTDEVNVHIHGTAQPGALIIAADLSRSFTDGRQYQASAIAAVANMPSDAGASTPSGTYDLWLEPQPDPAGGNLAAHHGDSITLYQLVRQPDNTFEQSTAVTIVVP